MDSYIAIIKEIFSKIPSVYVCPNLLLIRFRTFPSMYVSVIYCNISQHA